MTSSAWTCMKSGWKRNRLFVTSVIPWEENRRSQRGGEYDPAKPIGI